MKVYCYPEFFFQQQPCSCFLGNKHFERGPYFTLTPQQHCNANAKVPKKLSYNIFGKYSKQI